MAKVPGAAQIGQGPSLRDPGVNAPAAAFDMGGEALQEIGTRLGEVAGALKEKRQIATDNEYLTRYETDYAVRMAEAQQELEQQALEGQVEDLPGQLRARAKEIDSAVRAELSGSGLTPSDAATQATTRFGARTATRAMVQGVTFEHNARVGRAVSGIQGQLDTLYAKAARDPANYQAYQGEARILVGRLDDLVPSADRDKAIADAEQNIAAMAAQSIARDDPTGFLERVDGGEFDAVGDRLPTVVNIAQSELDRRNREAEARRARALRRAEAEVDDYAALSTLGFRPPPPDLSGLHPEDRARMQNSIEVSNAVATSSLALRDMSPAERDTALATMRQRLDQNPTARNLDIYEGLVKVANDITSAEEEDAFTLDVRWGNVDSWDGEGEPTIRNPDYWTYVTSNAEDVSRRHPNGMPIPAEAMAELEGAFEGEDIAAQTVAAQRLATLPGYVRAQIASRLEKSAGAEVSAAAMLSGIPGKASTVQAILQGRLMSGPDTLKPSANTVRRAVSSAYGSAFSGDLTGTQEALVAAGIALYQKRSGVTREELVDEAELERALKDVIPGSVIERNGVQTFIVGEVTDADTVSRALNAAAAADQPVTKFGAAFDGSATIPVDAVLHANGDPVTWEDILDGTLSPAAEGLFYVNTDFGPVKADVPAVPDVPISRTTTPALVDARSEAEVKYPFLRQFRNVIVQRAEGDTRRGLGEYYAADEPDNPNPGTPTIIVGPKSKDHPGGETAIIIADLIHAATDSSPEVQALKKELVSSFSDAELRLARRRYENDFKGKFTGSNFATFENFLNEYWADGVIQQLLLGEDHLEEFRKHNPDARNTLAEIEGVFQSTPPGPTVTAPYVLDLRKVLDFEPAAPAPRQTPIRRPAEGGIFNQSRDVERQVQERLENRRRDR